MAKFTKAVKQQKIDHAKQLYCKGFDFDSIGLFIGVATETLQKWALENDFEKERKSRLIALSELRNTILDSYAEMREGRKPKITADEAVKLATAFEKLSVNKKTITYYYDAFEVLCDEFLLAIEKTPKKKDKEKWFEIYQTVRKVLDTVTSKLLKDTLGDE